MLAPTLAATLTPAFAAALHAPLPAQRVPRSSAEASLVLFIGEAMRPPPELALSLARDGVRSLWLSGAEQALAAAALARFDAMVLDHTAVEGRAAPLMARLREALVCPLVVVAEQADEIDEIVALELGADLYLVRPLAARRLRAHLAALLRRRPRARIDGETDAHSDSTRYAEAGGWVLDTRAGRLLRGARQVPLTDLQSRLLQRLLAAPGHMVPRAELVAALPAGHRLQARSVDVYIHRLRQRLREQAVEGLAIEVVRGRGYVLEVGAAPG